MVQAGGQRQSRSDLHATPGVTTERDPATKDFIFQQTMLRIKEPKRSLDFYTRVLGMTLIAKLPFDEMSFTLYFLAYTKSAGDVADGAADRIEQCFGRYALPICVFSMKPANALPWCRLVAGARCSDSSCRLRSPIWLRWHGRSRLGGATRTHVHSR